MLVDDPATSAMYIDVGTRLGSFGVLVILAAKVIKWLPAYMRAQEERYDAMVRSQLARHDALLTTFTEQAKAERDQCKAQFEAMIEHSDHTREIILAELHRTPGPNR